MAQSFQNTRNDRPIQLQKLKMTSIANPICALMHRGTIAEGLVTDEKICAVADNSSGGCGGDSGGPITWQGAVVGVVSWLVRPCGTNPTVFIRVLSHLSWIQQNM
jgi:secreted trypsin-like serine protease